MIHRAEIFMEQVPGTWVMDSLFSPPNFLYMDLKDSTNAIDYKPVYYDLNPGISYNPDNTTNYYPQQVDYGYFGGYQRRRTDLSTGRNLAYYNFNVTRYLQKMVINHSFNYTFRLFAPFSINYPQYGKTIINYANSMAFGRVRVGGGANQTHKMKMVVIWSKIK